jgi:hypothetical protein
MCAHPHLVYARITLLCFKAPCQFITLPNLRSLIFGLTPFGWLHSTTLTSYFWWEFNFWFTPPSFTPIGVTWGIHGAKMRLQYIFYTRTVFFSCWVEKGQIKNINIFKTIIWVVERQEKMKNCVLRETEYRHLVPNTQVDFTPTPLLTYLRLCLRPLFSGTRA